MYVSIQIGTNFHGTTNRCPTSSFFGWQLLGIIGGLDNVTLLLGDCVVKRVFIFEAFVSIVDGEVINMQTV
jgi:hypothetical protein